jgi:hypothetical protein
MNAFRRIGVAAILFLSCAFPSFATTRYVDVSNAAPAAPYTNWGIASTNIQAAINAAASGDEILVAPGVYRLSGNAVEIPYSKTLTLRSTQSREAIIDAQRLCTGLVIIGSNSVVDGFAVRNGLNGSYAGGIDISTACTVRDCLVVSNQAAGGAGIFVYDRATVENCNIQSNLASDFGGGVLFYNSSSGLVNNCIIRDNIASNYGGGVAFQGGGSVSNCWIMGNRAVIHDGGGLYLDQGGEVVNSVVVKNEAGQYGGGVYAGGTAARLAPIVNCTIVSNNAGAESGGINAAYYCRMVNDIIYFNTAPTNANLYNHNLISIVSNCCLTTDYGLPSITNAPVFVNPGAGDFRLVTASPCIDAGTTNGAPGTDIEGNPRPRVGKPGGLSLTDIGAYEYGFHFNDMLFSKTNELQFLWDVQDRGIYKLEVETNGLTSPAWLSVAGYTNPGMSAGQFVVHTQTVAIPSPVPAKADFRLRISHTAAKGGME